MHVSDLIHRDVVTCSDRDTLERAAQLMWEFDIGCLPVVGGDHRLVGIITDRDVCMAAFLQGAPLRSICVSSIMSRDLVTCRETDDVKHVEQAMSKRQVRRVPVIDQDGQPIGMVSLNDIARAAYGGKLPSGELASTLAVISHPRLGSSRAS
jgi:CBS domain-containing protein